MKNEKKINALMLGLTVLGYIITGASLIVGQKQAKIHRKNDIAEVTEKVLKKLETK